MNKNLNPLNEAILDDLDSKPGEIDQGYMESFSKPKNNIKISKTIDQILSDKTIETIENNNKKTISKQDKSKSVQKRKKDVKIVEALENLPEQEYSQANEIVKDELEEVYNIDIPDNVDVIETEKAINDAVDNIPGNIDISDLEFTPISSKSKKGYHKSKVTFKSSEIPDQISKIASIVKKESKGIIAPRTTDLRIISNTNKTQLKSSRLKLSAISVTFRPTHGSSIKANKGTRIILSVSDNYSSTKDIILYFQEGSKKDITIMNPSNGFNNNEDQMNQWLANIITDFFTSGYDVVSKKILLRSVDNPLMQVIDVVTATHRYKARPHVETGRIISVDFKSKGSKNQWLYLSIQMSGVRGGYEVFAERFNDDEFQVKMAMTNPAKKYYTLEDLKKNIVEVLDKAYDHDWSETLGIGGVSIESRMKRLKHYVSLLDFRQMKLAYDGLMKYVELENENGVEVDLRIERVITKRDFMEKANLTGEAVVGRTNYCEFVLSYLLQPLLGKDARNSADFITSEDYYEKTGVKDRRKASQRNRSITVKQGVNRNYNSGDFLFMLEYESKGRKHKYMCKKFSDILKNTEFLSDSPKFPKSEYDKYLKD
jgi:hypothetical protein